MAATCRPATIRPTMDGRHMCTACGWRSASNMRCTSWGESSRLATEHANPGTETANPELDAIEREERAFCEANPRMYGHGKGACFCTGMSDWYRSRGETLPQWAAATG